MEKLYEKENQEKRDGMWWGERKEKHEVEVIVHMKLEQINDNLFSDIDFLMV